MRDLKIGQNARIPDYERDCLREVDLLIRDGKIEKIRERGAITEETAETIDARVADSFQQDLWISMRMRIRRRGISLRQNAVSRWVLLPKSPETAVIRLRICLILPNA